MVGQAVWTPGRPVAVGASGEARMFEHVFSSLLRKTFGRACDEFLLDMSQLIYPAAAPLESTRMLLEFRKRERERHRRMLERFSRGTNAEDTGQPALDTRATEDE